MQNSTSSSAGKIINSTTYNINFCFGQPTAIGNLASGNFNLSAGFTHTSSNLFRTVSLLFPTNFQILLSGSSHQIIWNSSFVSLVTIMFSSDNGANWSTIAESIDASMLEYTWTVPNINSDECIIRIMDATNNSIFDQSYSVFKVYNYAQNLDISIAMSFNDFTKTESFRMIGLPGMDNIPITQIFKGEYGKDWKAAYDNGASDNYLVEFDGSDNYNFSPGKGYWVHSKNAISFSRNVESVELNDDLEFLIPLHKGWNIISNPFLKTISWESIKLLNGISEDLNYYSNNYTQTNNFEAYKGYYFYNITSLNSLLIPYFPNAEPSNLGKKISNEELTNIIFGLKDENGNSSNILIGFDKSSKNSYDPLDKFAPPSDFERTSIGIYNPKLETDYQYLREDFRNNINYEMGQVYNLILKIPPHQTVSLDVVEMNIPEQLNINLIDTEFNNIYDLRSSKSVEINSLHVHKNFKLAIGSENFIDSIKTEYIVDNFELYQNYPNPFNPNTYIKFSVINDDLYSINISNILGEFIQTLHSGYLTSGTYEFEFVADNLPSGVYFYSVNSKSFSDTKKMILLK